MVPQEPNSQVVDAGSEAMTCAFASNPEQNLKYAYPVQDERAPSLPISENPDELLLQSGFGDGE